MESSGKLNYVFRKYPLLRWVLALFLVSVIIFLIIFYNVKSKPVPVINSINPPVGSPGDVVIIKGENFGEIRDMNYVEIAGSKLTSSSYISWEDDCIKLVLPANVQDGLVIVGTKDRRSEPVLFANEVDIPVPVPTVQQVTKPVINSFSSDKLRVGDVLVIQGNNFGDSKNQSKVMFSIDYNNDKIEDKSKYHSNMIPANEDDFDYISWSNTEIKVHVPDGASSGNVIVDTGKEFSDPKRISIDQSAGVKSFGKKKIYLLQYSADIDDVISGDKGTTITLRCPVPYTSVSQPKVEITEVTPEPILVNYQNNLVHQVTNVKSNSSKMVFNQNFVLPVFEVKTSVNPDKIGYYKNTEKSLLTKNVRADELIPSDNEVVMNLASKIVGREKNPYIQAKMIYNYMCDNFEIISKPRKSDMNPLDLIKKEKGDAYDFAIIYTALLRACGIPAVTNAGILVSQNLSTQSHWWCEFYVDRVGWIPVDPALGAGMEYGRWPDRDVSEDRSYYFGNMDSHHIIFSRGWNKLKPFSADNKIVQKPRSFALQSIWEEASDDVTKYSSYWSVPVVRGIY